VENPILKMKKDFKILILIFVFILGLSFITYWQFKGLQKPLTKVELPKFKMPEISTELWLGEKEGLKEWISPDGKLKMKYPAYWIEMEESSLKNFFQPVEGAEILLFAYRFKLENLTNLVFLVIQKLNSEKNLEKIIEEIKGTAKEKGIEIINLKIEENRVELETEYQSKTGDIFYSKEKLILAGENLYLISVFSPKKNWTQIEGEANEILSSIQLVP